MTPNHLLQYPRSSGLLCDYHFLVVLHLLTVLLIQPDLERLMVLCIVVWVWVRCDVITSHILV